MKQPNSQITAILYRLINDNKGVSERDFNFNGFRSRISELRDFLTIKETFVNFKNQFNHRGQFKRHWITNQEKKKAVKLYNSFISGDFT